MYLGLHYCFGEGRLGQKVTTFVVTTGKSGMAQSTINSLQS